MERIVKGEKQMNILNNIFLWLAIAVCIFAMCRNYIATSDNKIKPNEGEIPNRIFLILLSIAAVITLAVRIWKFGSVPGGFNQDGAMAAVDAKALSQYGTDRYGMHMPVHLTAWGYSQMSALLSYLMVPFIKIGGFNPISLRLPQLLATIAALVCLYLFIRDVFGKKMAIIVTLFAAVNPWNILQSRWALDCNLYPQFFMMGVFFLYKGLAKLRYLVISMIMFGLCMYCYGISIYTMPVFLAAACIYLLVSKKISIKHTIIALVVYLLVSWPFITTMAINFFKLDTIETPLFTLPYFPDSIRANDILFFSDNIGEQLAANFKALLDTTLLQKKDVPWNDIEGFGTMYLFSMPFVITGIVCLIKDFRKNTGAIIALLFLITGLWCGLTTNVVNVNRINIVYYPLIIMAGIGIYYIIKWVPYSAWGVGAAYAAAFIMLFSSYFTSYARTTEKYFYKDFGEALRSVKDTDADKIYVTPDGYYGLPNVSEILTLFYQDIDALYYQGKTNDPVPFNERYTFQNIKDININPDENAVYVITGNDRQYFTDSEFNFEQFGDYCVVTQKDN